jgi:hypothetical protein
VLLFIDNIFRFVPKGISNNIMASPPNHPKRRRRPSKKAAPAVKTTCNSQASRKRALDVYQNQLVARPAIPVSNRFTALRIVAKNSVTGQLRQAWEVPKPAPRLAQTKTSLRRQHKSQDSAKVIYKAHRTLKQRKNAKNVRSRQYVSRSYQSQNMAQPQAVISAPRSRRIIPKATPNVQ